MHKIVLLFGSNQGYSKDLILKAKKMLEIKIGKCVKTSSLYETEAWGFKAENKFLNQVMEFESIYKPREILQIALDIEKKLGRIKSTTTYVSRTMDIDLLFYDDIIIKDEDLQIPHPKIHKRRFTLIPLAEIMPYYVHPELKKPIYELLQSCNDYLSVTKLND